MEAFYEPEIIFAALFLFTMGAKTAMSLHWIRAKSREPEKERTVKVRLWLNRASVCFVIFFVISAFSSGRPPGVTIVLVCVLMAAGTLFFLMDKLLTMCRGYLLYGGDLAQMKKTFMMAVSYAFLFFVSLALLCFFTVFIL